MSAPDTNVEKQKEKHRPSLLGINAVLVYAAILLAAFIVYLVWNGNDPGEEDGATILFEPAAETEIV